jgi:hypothetical protein
MAFANTAYRRVTGHLTQCLNILCDKQCLRATSGSRQRSLGPGMTAADDYYIKLG